MVCIFRRRDNRETLPVAYLKGLYKFESSLMTCEAGLQGCSSRLACSILSLIGSPQLLIGSYYLVARSVRKASCKIRTPSVGQFRMVCFPLHEIFCPEQCVW